MSMRFKKTLALVLSLVTVFSAAFTSMADVEVVEEVDQIVGPEEPVEAVSEIYNTAAPEEVTVLEDVVEVVEEIDTEKINFEAENNTVDEKNVSLLSSGKKQIKDILADAKFPTGFDNGWLNSEGTVVAFAKGGLGFAIKESQQDVVTLGTMRDADSTEEGYTCTYNEYGGLVINFNLSGEKLVSFTISKGQDKYAVLNGIYTPHITTWKQLQESIDEADTTATITLTQDVIATSSDKALSIPTGKNITLDLNGHKLDRGLTEATVGGEVINISGGAALTITDTSDEKKGTITGGYRTGTGSEAAGGVTVNSNATFTMEAGTITGCYGTEAGGVYVASNATFTMDAGTISNNRGITGGVSVAGSFIMDGGTISGNIGSFDGGDTLDGTGAVENNGTFTMNGGSITGNMGAYSGINNENEFSMTGGIIAENENTDVKEYNTGFACCIFNGGHNGGNAVMQLEAAEGKEIQISGNKSGSSFGTILNIATLSLSGKVVVTDGDENTPRGLFQLSNRKELLGEESPIRVTGDLSGSDIVVELTGLDSKSGTGVLTSGYLTKNPGAGLTDFFHYCGDNYAFINSDGEIEIGDETSVIIDSEIENGKVESDKDKAATGDPVKITVTPDTGYCLKADTLKVTYVDDQGATQTVALTKDATDDTVYTFTKPGYHVTVTAEFEKEITFTVIYDGNGATSGTVPTDSKEYSSGATVTVLGNTGSLVKTGFIFNGWADESGTHYAAGGTFNITANTTLYAGWTEKADGPAAPGGLVAVAPTSIDVTDGKVTGVDETMEYSTDGGTNWKPVVETAISGFIAGDNVSIRVKETDKTKAGETATVVIPYPSYSIIYKDQGDTAFSGTHESGYPATHTYGTETALKSASKDRFTFGGWYTSSDCSGNAVTTLGAKDYTADITLYAKWLEAVTEITVPAGLPGVKYEVKDVTDRQNPVTLSPKEGTTAGASAYEVKIGAKIEITAIPAEGYVVVGTNSYVIEEVTKQTVVNPEDLPSVQSKQQGAQITFSAGSGIRSAVVYSKMTGGTQTFTSDQFPVTLPIPAGEEIIIKSVECESGYTCDLTLPYTYIVPDHDDTFTIPVKKKTEPSSDSSTGNEKSEPLFTGTWNNAVKNGSWSQDAHGIWHYASSETFRNTWGYIVNPYAKEGQHTADWFWFDRQGNMLTGWQFINGKWYYLNPSKDGTLGACQLGGVTPDGWTVDESGAWIESIPKK